MSVVVSTLRHIHTPLLEEVVVKLRPRANMVVLLVSPPFEHTLPEQRIRVFASDNDYGFQLLLDAPLPYNGFRAVLPVSTYLKLEIQGPSSHRALLNDIVVLDGPNMASASYAESTGPLTRTMRDVDDDPESFLLTPIVPHRATTPRVPEGLVVDEETSDSIQMITYDEDADEGRVPEAMVSEQDADDKSVEGDATRHIQFLDLSSGNKMEDVAPQWLLNCFSQPQNVIRCVRTKDGKRKSKTAVVMGDDALRFLPHGCTKGIMIPMTAIASIIYGIDPYDVNAVSDKTLVAVGIGEQVALGEGVQAIEVTQRITRVEELRFASSSIARYFAASLSYFCEAASGTNTIKYQSLGHILWDWLRRMAGVDGELYRGAP